MYPVYFGQTCGNGNGGELWPVFDRGMQALVDTVLGTPSAVTDGGRVDAWEDDGQVVIEAEMPGLSESDVNVTVEKGVLTIEAQRKDSRGREGRHYHMAERHYGPVTRRFRLGETVDAETIAASLVNGVLTVTLGKKAKPQPNRIEVKRGLAPEGSCLAMKGQPMSPWA